MIVTAAKDIILTSGFGINNVYIALGTGTNPATLLDSALQTETLRLPAWPSRYGNKLYFNAVLAELMPNASYTEVGLFFNGKLTKNSGQLISRKLNNFTKSLGIRYIMIYELEFTGFTNIV